MLPLWSVALVAITQLLSGLYLPLSGDLPGAVARSWCAVFGCASATISAPTYVATPAASSLDNFSGFDDLASCNLSSPASLLGVSAQSVRPEDDGLLPSSSEWTPVKENMASPAVKAGDVAMRPLTSQYRGVPSPGDLNLPLMVLVAALCYGALHICRYLARIPAGLLPIVAACIIKALKSSADAWSQKQENERLSALNWLYKRESESLKDQVSELKLQLAEQQRQTAHARTAAHDSDAKVISLTEDLRISDDTLAILRIDSQSKVEPMDMKTSIRRGYEFLKRISPPQPYIKPDPEEHLTDTAQDDVVIPASVVAAQDTKKALPNTEPEPERSSDLTVVEHAGHVSEPETLPIKSEPVNDCAIKTALQEPTPTPLIDASSLEHTVAASPAAAQESENHPSSIEVQENCEPTVVEQPQHDSERKTLPIKVDSVEDNAAETTVQDDEPTPLIETSQPEHTVIRSPMVAQESESRPSSRTLEISVQTSEPTPVIEASQPECTVASSPEVARETESRPSRVELQKGSDLTVIVRSDEQATFNPQQSSGTTDTKIIDKAVESPAEPMEVDEDSVMEKADAMDVSEDKIQPTMTTMIEPANPHDRTVKQRTGAEHQMGSTPTVTEAMDVTKTTFSDCIGVLVVSQSQQSMHSDQKAPVAEPQDVHMADQAPVCKEVEMSDAGATSISSISRPATAAGAQLHSHNGVQIPARPLIAEDQKRPQSRFPMSALTTTANTTSQQHSRSSFKASVEAGNPALHLHVPATTFPLASSPQSSIQASATRQLNLTTLFKTTLQLDGKTVKVVSPTQKEGGDTKSKAGSPKQLQGKAAKDRIQNGSGGAGVAVNTNAVGIKVATGDMTMRDATPSAPSATAASSA
ncbi:hypothetical protein LTR95_013077, partial [Oleoguttula sp. CCFEE 5521]